MSAFASIGNLVAAFFGLMRTLFPILVFINVIGIVFEAFKMATGRAGTGNLVSRIGGLFALLIAWGFLEALGGRVLASLEDTASTTSLTPLPPLPSLPPDTLVIVGIVVVATAIAVTVVTAFRWLRAHRHRRHVAGAEMSR